MLTRQDIEEIVAAELAKKREHGHEIDVTLDGYTETFSYSRIPIAGDIISAPFSTDDSSLYSYKRVREVNLPQAGGGVVPNVVVERLSHHPKR